MSAAENPYLTAWLALFRAMGKYFRFECEGFDHLRGPPSLIVGFHGTPFPVDVFMLSTRIHDDLGYMLPAIWLRAWGQVPLLRSMVPALNGFLAEPNPDEMQALIASRKHLVVLPGGSREGMRPFWRRYRLEWGERTGYLKLALRYGLPIVPIASSGTDDGWWGLVDGYRLSRRLFGHGGVPVWLGLGPLGFWPFSPPWPVKVRQRIGPPIDLDALRRSGESEEMFLARANEHVKGVVQSMLDDLNPGARRSAGLPSHGTR